MSSKTLLSTAVVITLGIAALILAPRAARSSEPSREPILPLSIPVSIDLGGGVYANGGIVVTSDLRRSNSEDAVRVVSYAVSVFCGDRIIVQNFGALAVPENSCDAVESAGAMTGPPEESSRDICHPKSFAFSVSPLAGAAWGSVRNAEDISIQAEWTPHP